MRDSIQTGIDNLNIHPQKLFRFSCQLLNSSGQASSARIYAESIHEAEQILKDACYQYANLSPSVCDVHPDQMKGIF